MGVPLYIKEIKILWPLCRFERQVLKHKRFFLRKIASGLRRNMSIDESRRAKLNLIDFNTCLCSRTVFISYPLKVARLDFWGLIPPNFEH